MRRRIHRRSAFVESLEGRQLLSSAAQYNLLTLLGYNRLGSSWTYALSGTGSVDGQSSSIGGTGTVATGKKTATYDKHASDVVKFTAGGITATTAWYNSSQNTYETLSTINSPIKNASSNLVITVNPHNAVVAPSKMTLGKTYKNTRTYTGTFSAPLGGQAATGTFSGNATFSTALLKTESVKVKAGTFNAVKGSYSLSISGTMNVKYNGATVPVTFKLTESDTFWAVTNVGIVKQTSTDEIDLNFPDQTSHVAKLQVTASLKSDVLT